MATSSNPSKPGPAKKPRDAATLIVVDTKSDEPRMLMGRRRPDLVFMPGKFVFPGGRVDQADKSAPSASELADVECVKLLAEMKGRPSPQRARALAMTAVRETFEETGLIIGTPANSSDETNHAQWTRFLQRGFQPDLSSLSLFARAITPPGRPRRFDTRFFCVTADAVSCDTGEVDEELSEVGWYTPAETVELELPPITRVVIEDLIDRLKSGPLGPSACSVPYYYQKHGNFRRDLLSPTGCHQRGLRKP
jgi:8-oxo-dGTP pyrophosphatase MutT (NUDIX family)